MGRALLNLSKSIVKNNSCLRNLYKKISHFLCLKNSKNIKNQRQYPLVELVFGFGGVLFRFFFLFLNAK